MAENNGKFTFLVGPTKFPISVSQLQCSLLRKQCDLIDKAIDFEFNRNKTSDNPTEVTEISVECISAENFEHFIRYTLNPKTGLAGVKLDLPKLINMALDADYALMENLLDFLLKRIQRLVRVANVWSILNDTNHAPRVARVCHKVLSKDTYDCLRVGQLRKATTASFVYFLQLPNLTIKNEDALINATLQLSKFHNFDKKWLRAALPHLRVLTLCKPEIMRQFVMILKPQLRMAFDELVTNGDIDEATRRFVRESFPWQCPIAQRRIPPSGQLYFEWRNNKRPVSTDPLLDSLELNFNSDAPLAITGLFVQLPETLSCSCKPYNLHMKSCNVRKIVRPRVIIKTTDCDSGREESTLLVIDSQFVVRKTSDTEAFIDLSERASPILVSPTDGLKVVMKRKIVSTQKSYQPQLLSHKFFPLLFSSGRRVEKITTLYPFVTKKSDAFLKGFYFSAQGAQSLSW